MPRAFGTQALGAPWKSHVERTLREKIHPGCEGHQLLGWGSRLSKMKKKKSRDPRLSFLSFLLPEARPRHEKAV